MEIIARIHTQFPTKFGIPRQSDLVKGLRGEIVFEPPYRSPDAVRGLDQFSHIWLIWQFSASLREGWSATVRPPRLGGNTRLGVFATRSPFRPNPLGLSCVRLLGVSRDARRGPLLEVEGADMMDGTPIYDIKPYLPSVDSRPEATMGFAGLAAAHRLAVDFPPELLDRIAPEAREALIGVLAQDPRPAYQRDEARRYGVPFAGWDVRFTVSGDELHVVEVVPYEPAR